MDIGFIILYFGGIVLSMMTWAVCKRWNYAAYALGLYYIPLLAHTLELLP